VTLAAAARRPPEPHEVEIAVEATGVNFRDVLLVLGMYPSLDEPLGSECAGRVVAVGAAVADLAVGDRVVAVAPHSFDSHVRVPRPLVARGPTPSTPRRRPRCPSPT
jgi:NADPH:quinone reductase-like Zn-dependent oxidoreductase